MGSYEIQGAVVFGVGVCILGYAGIICSFNGLQCKR